MPSPKDSVAALMTFEGREKKFVTEKDQRVECGFRRFRCPKPSFPQRVIEFKENNGYQNPYMYLRSCCGRGKPAEVQKAMLDEMFEEAKHIAYDTGGSIVDHFRSAALSEYEQAMHRYIRLIVHKRVPISTVADSELRAVSCFSFPID